LNQLNSDLDILHIVTLSWSNLKVKVMGQSLQSQAKKYFCWLCIQLTGIKVKVKLGNISYGALCRNADGNNTVPISV